MRRFWLQISPRILGLCGMLGLAAGITPNSAAADILVLRSGHTMFGQSVEQSGGLLIFRERIEGTKYIERRISQADCLTTIDTIDETRLASLDPQQPAAYAALAEELAMLRVDPEARDLAIRLLLIAARAAESDLRHRCFLTLISVARSPHEEQLFRKLAYRYDPQADRSLLDDRFQVAPTTPAADWRDALRVVRGTRQGQSQSVSELYRETRVQDALGQLADVCHPDQLRRLMATRQHSAEDLLRLLQLEYAIERQLHGWQERTGDDTWSQQIEQAEVFTPDWDNVSEFRTDETQYVNGRWQSVRPATPDRRP